jgi:hypothetical protein
MMETLCTEASALRSYENDYNYDALPCHRDILRDSLATLA